MTLYGPVVVEQGAPYVMGDGKYARDLTIPEALRKHFEWIGITQGGQTEEIFYLSSTSITQSGEGYALFRYSEGNNTLRYEYGTSYTSTPGGDVVMVGYGPGDLLDIATYTNTINPLEDPALARSVKVVTGEGVNRLVVFGGSTAGTVDPVTVTLNSPAGTVVTAVTTNSVTDGSVHTEWAGYYIVPVEVPTATEIVILQDLSSGSGWLTKANQLYNTGPLRPGVAPLRYRQRNDGVRQGRSSSSKQASTRQGWPNTYL